MKNTWLISAATAALIASGGLAYSQATSQDPAVRPPANTPTTSGGEAAKTDQNTANEHKPGTAAKGSKGATTEENVKSDAKAASDAKSDTKASKSSDSKAQGAAESQSSTTTGQGAAGTSASLSTEQRSQISTVIRQQKVQPLTNVNFSITVGAKVPRNVRFHPLPARVIEVYPAWRGYEFILVGNDIVVINPRTLEIVAVISA